MVLQIRHSIWKTVTLVVLQISIIPQQLVHATAEGKEDKEVEDEPLGDVDSHPTEGDLERTEVGIDGEDVDQLEEGGDHAGAEQALGDQVGVVRVPFLSRIEYLQYFPQHIRL